jgi:hypothetical protein
MNVRFFPCLFCRYAKKAILGLIRSPLLLISLTDLLNVRLMDLSVSLHITTLHMWEGISASTSHFLLNLMVLWEMHVGLMMTKLGEILRCFFVGYMVPAFSA